MLTTALASPACTCSANANDRAATPSSPSRSCRDNEAPPSSGSPRRHHHQKSAQQMSNGVGAYVYPKLQLVQIDDAWYALNQTCLQIYQQLQMCGTAQLMPVDVVPLNKLPECVRKSLSSSPDGDGGKCGSGNRRHKREPAAAAPGDGERRKSDEGVERHASFRVYDVMSDSVNGSGKPPPANQRHQQQPPNNANNHNVANSDHEKSWWWRLFPYCSSLSGTSAQQQSTHPESIRPADNSRRYAARQVHRRQHQIVQKLMEETSLIGGTGDIHHASREAAQQQQQQPVDLSSDVASVCVVCQSTFANHRLLQRHRERVNHYGCSVCFKSFKSSSSLQDHCDLLSHWSEGDSDDDSVDLDSDDEYFFSSETSDDD